MRGVSCSIVIACALACDGTPSTFDFTLDGDIAEHVTSGASVNGEIDNAGHLALSDGDWSLQLSIGGLGLEPHDFAKESGDTLTVIHKSTGDLFTTELGGTCTITLDPHGSTNGDRVHGTFYCSGLTSNAATHVDVKLGEFDTAIDDSANDPNLNPPHP